VAIEAVIFDYGGVLSVSPFAGLARVEERYGLPRGTLSNLLGYGIDVPETAPGEPVTNHWHLLEMGAIGFDEYAAWVDKRAEEIFGAPVDVMSRLSSNGASALTIFWPMVHEVRRLRAEGYRTAICTNNIREFRTTWETHVPLEWFDVVVDSSDVGVRKPDPAIYRLTADRLGVAPAACVFIDDHPGNVAGAERVGMKGLRVVDDDVIDAITRLRALLVS
jgi:putative hydrolase of the HAD superfamily